MILIPLCRLSFCHREKYENLVEDNYEVRPRRVGVMQMSRVSSYSDCECDQQMQVTEPDVRIALLFCLYFASAHDITKIPRDSRISRRTYYTIIYLVISVTMNCVYFLLSKCGSFYNVKTL